MSPEFNKELSFSICMFYSGLIGRPKISAGHGRRGQSLIIDSYSQAIYKLPDGRIFQKKPI
jgi:hypothetical protein